MLAPNTDIDAYRIWPSKHRGRKLVIRSITAQELAWRARDASRALPKRGLEVGGLLLGFADSKGIRIDCLWPIESEYKEGPTYRVTRTQLTDAVREARARAAIVGIYRSRTDGGLDLDGQDRSMLEALGSGKPLAVVTVRQYQSSVEAIAAVWERSEAHWLGPPRALDRLVATAMVDPQARVEAGGLPESEEQQPPFWRKPLMATLSTVALVLLGLSIWMVFGGRASSGIRERARAAGRAVFPTILPETGERAREVTALPQSGAAAIPKPATPPPPRREFQPPPVRPKAQAVPNQNIAALTAPQIATPAGIGTADLPVRPTLPQMHPAPPPPSAAPTTAPKRETPAVAEFSPPVLAQQGQSPSLSADLRRKISRDMTLDLRVSVNEAGRVTRVSPVRNMGKNEAALWNAYASAVHFWVFTPAKRNGRPVPADTILKIRLVQPN